MVSEPRRLLVGLRGFFAGKPVGLSSINVEARFLPCQTSFVRRNACRNGG